MVLLVKCHWLKKVTYFLWKPLLKQNCLGTTKQFWKYLFFLKWKTIVERKTFVSKQKHFGETYVLRKSFFGENYFCFCGKHVIIKKWSGTTRNRSGPVPWAPAWSTCIGCTQDELRIPSDGKVMIIWRLFCIFLDHVSGVVAGPGPGPGRPLWFSMYPLQLSF